MGAPGSSADLSAIPLFPLPNAVLFPRAVLPLHIFEQRYKQMTADALAGKRQIAMALLRPGWEKNYYDRPAIEPVVCVGTIVSHEMLPDGKYNFLLQGHARACVVEEIPAGKPYRVAGLRMLDEIPAPESELLPLRARIERVLNSEAFGGAGLARQLRKLLDGPWPTPDIADLLAFNYFEDPLLKQLLLSEVDVLHRVARIVAELESIRPEHPVSSITLHRPSLN